MVIILTVTYPPESGKQMAARFLEAPQAPDFMTRRGPYITSSISEGVLATAIYELDNSRLAEGLQFLGEYAVTFYGIPGYRYQYKPYLTVEEGLKILGM